MPATPAWPPQSTPRLFVDSLLSEELELRIDGGQAHYLLNVMRMKVGAPLKLFDDRSGEWLGAVAVVAKRDLIVHITGKLREREAVPDLWLLAAPIKKARLDVVVEKASELGVALYRPVITRRTIVERIKQERLRSIMIEAAEQCGRTSLPKVESPIKLEALLKDWPMGRALFFADENGGVPAPEAFTSNPGPAALLIGPEGGFDATEREALLACPQVKAISLGPRILRAETAAIAAASLWMAGNGDWSTPR
jgi:16S rRNA (uracil1498-N3)-methyltransferase